MDFVEEFQRHFGGRWIGVKFYFDELPTCNESRIRDVRFCEAVTRCLIRPVLLTPGDLNCYGACYVFGWDAEAKAKMVERFHQQEGFSERKAEELVQNLPKVNGSLKGIGLNIKNGPDILLSYLQPGQLMKVLRRYQIHFGEELNVGLSSVVSVCGHVAVEAFVNGRVAISFGCSDARQYGGITRDRIAIGVPLGVAKDMLGENR